jgi:predicted N-acetyltransferase YhbS
MNLQVRTETPDDYAQVYRLNYDAFGQRDDESQLVERIRNSNGFIPELSIVAEYEGEIVGHVLLSQAYIVHEKGEYPVIALAPIAVHPSMQKQGVGKALIEEGLKRCKELHFGLVFLIGHPSYYPQFGFEPARALGFELKQFQVPDEVFMVRMLVDDLADVPRGELQYPAIFL